VKKNNEENTEKEKKKKRERARYISNGGRVELEGETKGGNEGNNKEGQE
jgi:hypothetical protein